MREQAGVSLIVVLLILVIVSILGVGGVQLAMMGERSTRNDRDMQIAWQAAEAALLDAQFDIEGQPASYSGEKRNEIFGMIASSTSTQSISADVNNFTENCGNSGKTVGLCILNPAGKPAWLMVDFTATGADAATVEFGRFTGRDFPSGTSGVRSVKPPRYIIEQIPDPSVSATESAANMRYVYRITAMGFGPNENIQAVLQIIYRK